MTEHQWSPAKPTASALREGAPRLAFLPTLPIFFKLRGRQALIAGGGVAAVWKAEVLCAAGAMVTVVADPICPELQALAETLGPQALRLVHRDWRLGDLDGMAMALGAIEHDDEAARFRDAATAAGVPVNVIDKPAFCDFQFGTLVARGPTVIAITTDGAAPVFGQAIRARLEAWLPEGLRAWAEAAKDWRPQVQARDLDFKRRRRFWEIFADRALASPETPPTDADRLACFAAIDEPAAAMLGGVTLVGSGLGTTASLTFAAARALQSAELLLFEPTLPEGLVNLARREATKRGITSNAEAVTVATAEAAEGRRVVWLGTGNPNTCRRWRDRVDSLSRAGIAPALIEGLGSCPLCSRCPDAGSSGP